MKVYKIWPLFFFTSWVCNQNINSIELFGQHGHRHFSIVQRKLVAAVINEYEHCNLLVIGAGMDSGLWMEINKNGTTRFLEHDPFWISECQELFPGIQISKTTYKTSLPQWSSLLNLSDFTGYLPPVEEVIINTSWDVIILDGPSSHETMLPCHSTFTIGRMQAFFLVKFLIDNIQKDVYIFVHDTDRQAELQYGDKLFGSQNLINELENLRQYKYKNMKVVV